jgi:hypothetical protein
MPTHLWLWLPSPSCIGHRLKLSELLLPWVIPLKQMILLTVISQTRTSPQVSMFLFGFHIGRLVGGLNPSEKYYIVNWDYYSQYMET